MAASSERSLNLARLMVLEAERDEVLIRLGLKEEGGDGAPLLALSERVGKLEAQVSKLGHKGDQPTVQDPTPRRPRKKVRQAPKSKARRGRPPTAKKGPLPSGKRAAAQAELVEKILAEASKNLGIPLDDLRKRAVLRMKKVKKPFIMYLKTADGGREKVNPAKRKKTSKVRTKRTKPTTQRGRVRDLSDVRRQRNEKAAEDAIALADDKAFLLWLRSARGKKVILEKDPRAALSKNLMDKVRNRMRSAMKQESRPARATQ